MHAKRCKNSISHRIFSKLCYEHTLGATALTIDLPVLDRPEETCVDGLAVGDLERGTWCRGERGGIIGLLDVPLTKSLSLKGERGG